MVCSPTWRPASAVVAGLPIAAGAWTGRSAACTSSVSPASRVAIRALAIASCALAPTHSNPVPGPRCGSVCRSIAAVPMAAAIIAVPSSVCWSVPLARRGDCPLPSSWGVGPDPGTAARRLRLASRATVKDAEADLERRVSAYIVAMPFLWLDVSDAPSQQSARGSIERNAIALLSLLQTRLRPTGWERIATARECANPAYGTAITSMRTTTRPSWARWPNWRVESDSSRN